MITLISGFYSLLLPLCLYWSRINVDQVVNLSILEAF